MLRRLPSLEDVVRERVEARWWRPISEQKRGPNDGADNRLSLSSSVLKVGDYEIMNSDLRETSDSKRVECLLCPRQCRIANGKTGRCLARINKDGRLYSRFYGRPCSIAVDPIEKKPLFHFLPGSPILSLGTLGCNLTCKFCQNWQISQTTQIRIDPNNVVTPESVVKLALARRCPSVAFTYNEPTIWAEFIVDASKLCRAAGIKTVLVTNGIINSPAREELYEATDAANVDLKAFTSSFYKELCDGSLDTVKETLLHIVHNSNAWLEITNLLIPTRNDSLDDIKRMCDWIYEQLGPRVPLHFSAFFPTWRLTNVPPTPSDTILAAKDVAEKSGLAYVYTGNIADDLSQSTFCPQCGTLLVKRSRYQTQLTSNFTTEKVGETETDVNANKSNRESHCRYCKNCGRQIDGIF